MKKLGLALATAAALTAGGLVVPGTAMAATTSPSHVEFITAHATPSAVRPDSAGPNCSNNLDYTFETCTAVNGGGLKINYITGQTWAVEG
jgi:hypothetical protein